MDKQLPKINDESAVHEYMSMLLDNGKKKEYMDTAELLDYISGMEKQLEELTQEVRDFRETFNSIQNPSTKMRLTNLVDQVQLSINDGRDKLNKLKVNIVSSMKDCLAVFKEKGKNGVVKTINVLHFKEALGGIRKSFFIAMNKTNNLVQTCDAVSLEMRKAKRNFKNAGLLLLGKPVQKDTGDKNKLNMMQKTSRSIFSGLKSMTVKTTNLLHRLEDFEKPSVKSEIKLLSSNSKTKDLRQHEKKEQSR